MKSILKCSKCYRKNKAKQVTEVPIINRMASRGLVARGTNHVIKLELSALSRPLGRGEKLDIELITSSQ